MLSSVFFHGCQLVASLLWSIAGIEVVGWRSRDSNHADDAHEREQARKVSEMHDEVESSKSKGSFRGTMSTESLEIKAKRMSILGQEREPSRTHQPDVI